MWIEREKLKPRAERRPVPQPAAAIGSPGGGSGKKLNAAEMAAYNEAATKQFNERALAACPNCGRTFFEDRIRAPGAAFEQALLLKVDRVAHQLQNLYARSHQQMNERHQQLMEGVQGLKQLRLQL